MEFDHELLGEISAGLRMFYKGFFAYGIDNTVVNVTKDRIWIREAALSDFAGVARQNPQWVIQNMYDNTPPTVLQKRKWTVAGNQEKAIRDLEIDPALFTPKDQIRKWYREFLQDAKIEDLLGGAPVGLQAPKK